MNSPVEDVRRLVMNEEYKSDLRMRLRAMRSCVSRAHKTSTFSNTINISITI